MSDFEAEKEKDPAAGPQGQMGGQTAEVLTVSATFSGTSVTLNMSGIGDMGGDNDVQIYAASGDTPASRRTGATDQRANLTPPQSFPTALAGGSWTRGTNYWVQVDDQVDANGDWGTWVGSVTAAAGTLNISLSKQ